MEDANGKRGVDERKIHIYNLPKHLSKVTFVEVINEKWRKKGAKYVKLEFVN